MAWRFKSSKYKNAAPKIPAKENWISDIPIGTLGQSCGDHIKSSAAYIAYNTEFAGGGSLGLLPVAASGRQALQVSMLLAAGDLVTDFHFSPFDDYLLATGAQDNMVKLWQLPETLEGNVSDCLATVTREDRRIENVLWHPTADGVLAVSCHTAIKVFNAGTQQQVFASDVHKDQVQSVSWHGNGTILATTCRDKKLRTFDPRAGKLAQEGNGHQNVKESRVMWLGAKDQMITTGFTQMRQRDIKLWDTRSLSSPLYSLDLDSSTGTLMPFFDPDTNMVFFAGQGDVTVSYMELTDKHPYLSPCSTDRVEQIKGAALVPKRALDVMSGEVNRLLILSQNAIIPYPYVVPRKSYREYHSDLYPDTTGSEPALLAQEWLAGKDGAVPLISLNPAKKQAVPSRRGGLMTRSGGASVSADNSRGGGDADTAFDAESPAPAASQEPAEEKPSWQPTPAERATPPKPAMPSRPKPSIGTKPAPSQSSPSQDSAPRSVFKKPDPKPELAPEPEPEPTGDEESKPAKVFTGVRVSKCRHLKGVILHRSLHLENLRNLSRTTPGESDMFHANRKRCVLPIDGPGGLLAVLELDKPGRLPDTGVPVLQNGSKVCDFVWDPFDDSRLVVGCEDAKIRVWHIPEGGVTETLTEPSSYLKGHTEKLYLMRFHPMAKDLLVSSSYDMTTRLWNLATGQEVTRLEGHTDQVFSVAWSPNGKRLATVCKDGKIRIYDPRGSSEPITEGPGPEGSRGARIAWVLGGTHLLVTGFGKGSTRLVALYEVADLSRPLATEELDVSPAILVPFYDEDTATLFLNGRGDTTIVTYEVLEESPYLFPLAPSKLGGAQQALSFLPKTECDVRVVEFARAWRLTANSVEPVSFTIPRVKMEYFQDDLFPETNITYEPLMSCEDWFKGLNSRFRTVDLRPPDMKPLSEAPAEAPRKKKYESYNPETFKTDKQKKEELVSAMVSKLDVETAPLPQEQWEGVDEEEWDDY